VAPSLRKRGSISPRMDPYMIYVSDCGVLIAACPDDKTLVRAGSDGVSGCSDTACASSKAHGTELRNVGYGRTTCRRRNDDKIIRGIHVEIERMDIGDRERVGCEGVQAMP
jgi:hypothetical protein